MGEGSLCINRLGLIHYFYVLFIYKFVTTNTFNCHNTIAIKNYRFSLTFTLQNFLLVINMNLSVFNNQELSIGLARGLVKTITLAQGFLKKISSHIGFLRPIPIGQQLVRGCFITKIY